MLEEINKSHSSDFIYSENSCHDCKQILIVDDNCFNMIALNLML